MRRFTLFLLAVFAGFLAFSQGPGDLSETEKLLLEKERSGFEQSLQIDPSHKAMPWAQPNQNQINPSKVGALQPRGGKTISVLVASPDADDFNTHVLATMQSFGGTTYTVTAQLGALTVDEMLNYDVVWTFNVKTWETGTGTTAGAWSDKLGAFITQGGYLVECQFVNSYDNWGLNTGAYMTGNMSPFIKSTLDRPSATFNLGEVLVPSHPIMAGVTNVSTTYFVQDVVARNDATLIAKWGNAQADPLVAVYDNIAAFNANPLMSTGSVIQPGVTGNGYLMFHNTIVWLYNNQADPGAPAAPTGLTATPGAMGALSVELEWTNPTTTFDGGPLTEISAITIHRDGALIHTINTPAVGAVLTYTDNTMTTAGIYNYSVIAENTLGQGPAGSVSVYVGEDVPAAPGNITLVAQGNAGYVTWTAPNAGLNGGYINPANTTYKLVRMPGNVEVANGITATEYFDNTIPGIGNYSYVVTSLNAIGTGGSATSNIALLGAEGVLMYETFDYPTGAIPPGWTVSGLGAANWSVFNSNSAGGTAPELRLNWTPSFNGLSRIITYPVNVADQSPLRLKFKQFLSNYTTNEGEKAAIDVSFDGGTTWTTLWEVVITENIPVGNYELFFDVPEGKTTLHFGFRFEGNSFNINQWYIDNLLLEPVVDYDLVAVSVSGSTTPTAGSQSMYTVSVQNAGNLSASGYNVKLMKEGGIELGSVPGTPLDFSQTASFQIPWTPGINETGPTFLYGYVEFAADEIPGNNQTPNFNVFVQEAGIVAVTIGSGDLNLYMPYNFLYHHSLSQTLYYPDEIEIGGGLITALQYKNFFNADYLDRSIQIWMGETELDNLSAGWVDPASLQLVFSGTVDFPAGTNDILIPLDVPYIYGGGNLVIYSHKSDIVWSGSKYFKGTADADSNRSRRAQQDNNPFDPTAPSGGLVQSDFPNIVLYFSTAGLGSLEGIVTDGTDPLEGVMLTVEGTNFSATTNAEGEYSFGFLPEGDHVLVASLIGYGQVSEPFVIEAGQTTVLNIELTPLSTVSVSGFVAGDRNPLVGLEGALVQIGGYAQFETLTDADGNFSFGEVFVNQTYTILVEAFSHIPYEAEFEVGETDLVLDDIILEYTDIFEVVIGTATTFTPGREPFDFFYKNSLSQTLYYPDEIGLQGGVLTEIRYHNNFSTSLPGKPIKVWVGETTLANLSQGWVDPATLTLVYDGLMDFPSGINVISIPLEEEFFYNGGNLVIYTHRVWEDQYFSSNDRFYGTQMANSARSRSARADATVFDPAAPPAGSVVHWNPNTTLVFSTAGLGALQGTVTDGTDPLEGVKVRVLGTMASTMTNENGVYSFPFLMNGTYDVEFDLFGYFVHVEEDVVVLEEETTVLNIDLVAMSQYSVSGVVKGNDDLLLEGAMVKLEGYQDYTVMTDEDGAFIIEDVFEGTYVLTVAAEGYEVYVNEALIVDGDLDLGDIIVNEIIVAPVGLAVDVDGQEPGNALLTWSTIQEVEFRWDDGVAIGQLGSSGGTLNTVLGSAHRNNAVLSEMSWYLTDNGGPHNFVKVWVFGLDANGNPNPNDVLYQQANVPNVDLQWNTHVFPDPVAAPNGFLIGLSYQGFLAIGRDDGIGDWPFQPNTHFFNSNYTADPFQAIETLGDFQNNFLIRAVGLNYGALNSKGESIAQAATFGDLEGGLLAQPLKTGFPVYESHNALQASKAFTGFNVYLNDMETPVADEITETEYLFTDLEEGDYTAGVQSVYTTGVSEIVTINFQIVFGVPVTVEVSTNSGESAQGALVVLTNETFSHYEYTGIVNADGVVTFDVVRKGLYTLTITKAGFEEFVDQNINIQDEITLTAQLIEIIVAPFGLMVVEGPQAGEATFSWNNTTSWSQSFEGGIIPEGWTRVINNNGTQAGFPCTWTITGTINFTTPIVPQDGDYQAFMMWSYNHQDEWLVTPEFAAPAGDLVFWYYGTNGSTNADNYYVKVSTNGGASWTILWNASALPAGANPYQTPAVIDLSAFAGENIHIAWNNVDGPGNDGLWYAWAIDNISVGGQKLDVRDLMVAQGGDISTGVNLAARDGEFYPLIDPADMYQRTKAFVGYNVFLDNLTTPLVTNVSGTQFLFTGLANGNYVAGVQSVYTSGASEVVTIPFTITNGVVDEKYEVTFRVHMHAVEYDPDSDIIYFSGSLPEPHFWSQPGTNPEMQMEHTDDPMILSITFELEAGTYQYKYFMGPGWNGGEWMGDPNREVLVDEDMIIDNVFGNINDPINVSVLKPGTLSVFPNPARNVLHVVSGDMIREIRLIDMLGQVVYNTAVQTDRHELNVSGFRNGIYFIQILTANGLTTQRIQIMK